MFKLSSERPRRIVNGYNSRTALMTDAATLSGCDHMDTWLGLSSMVMAFIIFASALKAINAHSVL
jgi:hypothetical protein